MPPSAALFSHMGAGCLLFGGPIQADPLQACQLLLSSQLKQAGFVSPIPQVVTTPADRALQPPSLSWKWALEELFTSSISSGPALVARLQALVTALSHSLADSVWSENGVLGGLRRALSLAQCGRVDHARQVCSELLSLAMIVERRWQVHDGRPLSDSHAWAPSVASGDTGTFRQPATLLPPHSSSGTSSSSSATLAAAPSTPRQHQQHAGVKRPLSTSSSSSQTAADKRARPSNTAAPAAGSHIPQLQLLPGVPALSTTDLQRHAADGMGSQQLVHTVQQALHASSAHTTTAPEHALFGPDASSTCDEDASPSDTVTWSGVLKHKLDHTVVDLCPLTAVLPAAFAERFPAAIYADELLHRRQVSLGKHAVCRCSLGGLSQRQQQALASLAHCQLVAVVRLQHCALHLVPYFDNAHAMRMVGFLKALAS